ncbi:aquaporin [Nocardioides sp.]|uniref:aquaporin n=1 Tax=Nocardioides sp. TaxID=35761 RepID=UPI003564761D
MAETSSTREKIAAEVIGTFVLVFFGCGTAIMTSVSTGFDYVATALAFGLTVLVGAYAFGRVSGAHFNPAVSVGAALGGRMAWHQVPLYVGSQLVGALTAGLLLFILVHGFDGYDVGTSGLAQNSFGEDGTGYAVWAAFLLELLLTAVFVWVILAVTDSRNEHPALAPAAIGLALAMVHLASIGATGTSVNPARSIGVGVFAGSTPVIQLWLFILAPLAGAAIAGITYPALFGHGSDPVPGSGLRRPAAPGYGAPDQFQQEWNQEAAATAAATLEPIIQDGWQWDYAAQEWKLLEQTPQPPAEETTSTATAVTPAEDEDSGAHPTPPQ